MTRCRFTTHFTMAALEMALDNLYDDLVSRLDPTEYVLDFLYERHCVTDLVYERINELKDREEQCKQLLDVVKRKENIPEFIEALSHENSHTKLAIKLKEEIKRLEGYGGQHKNGGGGKGPTSIQMEWEVSTEGVVEFDSVPLRGGTEMNVTMTSEEKFPCVQKHPPRTNVMTGKHITLTNINFKLRILSSDGSSGCHQFDEVVTRIRCSFGHDPDILFHMLDAETARRRVFHLNEVDQTDTLALMYNLINYLTHPLAGLMMLNARKASVLAMQGYLIPALQLISITRSQAELIEPCKDTGAVVYTETNLLLQWYEIHPCETTKQRIINNCNEAIDVHFAHASYLIKEDYTKMFLLKMAFSFLGVGCFLGIVPCQVSSGDIQNAEQCLRQVDTKGLYNRHSMFHCFAKAVINYHRDDILTAYKFAEEAKLIAETCEFIKELECVKRFMVLLCSKYSELTMSSLNGTHDNKNGVDGFTINLPIVPQIPRSDPGAWNLQTYPRNITPDIQQDLLFLEMTTNSRI